MLILALLLLTCQAQADPYYLRPIDDVSHFTDAADYESHSPPFDAPAGMEWMQGAPPADATGYIKPTIESQLDAVFETLDVDTRASLATLATAVKLELDQGHPDVAKAIIQQATIPAELEALRTQMLGMFP